RRPAAYGSSAFRRTPINRTCRTRVTTREPSPGAKRRRKQKMERRMRRWQSTRGQSPAMVIVMLWVLILFVALVANVGQAVNRRVALQVVADAGAYTGATKMAEGMNYIAYANGTIQDYWALATDAWAVNTAAFDTCAGFDAINEMYEGLYQAMNIPIQIIDGFGPFGYGGAIGGGRGQGGGQGGIVGNT